VLSRSASQVVEPHLAVGLDVKQRLLRIAPSTLPHAPVLQLAMAQAGLTGGHALTGRGGGRTWRSTAR